MIAWPFQKTKPPSSPEKLTCWFPFLLAEEFHLFPTFFSLISRLHHHSKLSSLSFQQLSLHLSLFPFGFC